MPHAEPKRYQRPDSTASVYRPLVDFMIIGAQKCGTSALWHYLGQHPGIGMSSVKEPHVFDSPDYAPEWTSEQIDERYRPYFRYLRGESAASGEALEEAMKGTATPEGTPTNIRVLGEATPIYLLLPEIPSELKRYNPDLKLIVLIRDPVERAVSHYYMERGRDREHLPLWRALLSEPGRLWRCPDPRAPGSAWRRHSYRRRGLYSLQLRNLYRYFDTSQVLVLRTEDLALRHAAVLQRVSDFLGVSVYRGVRAETVFAGERGNRRHRLVAWLLRLSYLRESIRMHALNAPRSPG